MNKGHLAESNELLYQGFHRSNKQFAKLVLLNHLRPMFSEQDNAEYLLQPGTTLFFLGLKLWKHSSFCKAFRRLMEMDLKKWCPFVNTIAGYSRDHVAIRG